MARRTRSKLAGSYELLNLISSVVLFKICRLADKVDTNMYECIYTLKDLRLQGINGHGTSLFFAEH